MEAIFMIIRPYYLIIFTRYNNISCIYICISPFPFTIIWINSFVRYFKWTFKINKFSVTFCKSYPIMPRPINTIPIFKRRNIIINFNILTVNIYITCFRSFNRKSPAAFLKICKIIKFKVFSCKLNNFDRTSLAY